MLTKKQRKILKVLEEFILKKGYSPSVRELGKELGLSSPATIHSYLLALERKGYIKRAGREIKILHTPLFFKEKIEIPLVGLVPAGYPKEVFENLGENIEIPEWISRGKSKKNLFCIQVEGKSMIDAYIDDGDIVILEKANTASSGEMVLALLDDGSVTLKRLKLEKDGIYLIPENPEFKPIKIENLKIIGKVIGVIRRY
ncbi:transcriptional repressor LexA [Candidatus Aminicenantes bacterium AC-708-M15]|jgi:repressor LexA|nr:transcriptional repressor LexA [SCandidatus Aminicenantes bacterium Aminicenantia_JdfR_composite]MCP2597142.1 transcriptional repressor LexA [Candidatus Aminicenantes bacterium AC-335-G13]MCP2604297.1 transcriptional repressor LexA [Candidatus Aminicenantes bacterium AC-708-M15]MCP2617989.1 transcriptional repressor LexA [Candidatus Aminicenantes bacterium AC-335-A11]MCP2619465.1 transcriptional repressor LexA [Candidatus Aminicenantes bacterium AC-335-K20]MCP2620707.1 transcriptional repre